MPDTIDHIEVVKGSLPKRNGLLTERLGEEMDAKLIFIETSNAKDGDEWYTVYDLDALVDMIAAMNDSKVVQFFQDDTVGNVKERKVVDRKSTEDKSKKAKFKPFRKYKIT